MSKRFQSPGNQFKDIENFALLVTADAWFNNNRTLIVQLCDYFNLPAIYQWHEFADIGGLISYGPSIGQAYHSAGSEWVVFCAESPSATSQFLSRSERSW